MANDPYRSAPHQSPMFERHAKGQVEHIGGKSGWTLTRPWAQWFVALAQKVAQIAFNTGTRNLRTRVTTAQVNAGYTLLPALAGYKYRIYDVTMIAIGGNAATATAVTINATQSAGAAVLISAAIAALTQSAVVKPNSANVTVLADGASFIANDVNTAITIGKTGGALATATNIDVLLSYTIES